MGDPPDGIRYIQGPEVPPPQGRISIYRLTISELPAIDYDPAELAQTIENSIEGTVFFCDSNMFLAPTDDRIWDALLQKRRLYLIPAVYKELEYWLRDPRGKNLKAHAVVSQISSGESDLSIVPFQFPNELSLRTAYEYYVNLLSMRKRPLAIMREQYREEHGIEPTNQELNNYCQNKIGVRGLNLARDGQKALASGSRNFYTDEELVTAAYFFAILQGRETVILSRDDDIQEQFVKLKTRMVDHYCSMALADRYADDRLSLITRPMPMDHPIIKDVFVGESNLLIDRPSKFPDEVVPIGDPVVNRGVPIYCWLPREQLTQTCFLAETGMKRLLEVKGNTGGLSTDRLDGRNCHIWLGRRIASVLGNRAAIAEEVAYPLAHAKLGFLDINLIVNNDEPFRRLQAVDPRQIILP